MDANGAIDVRALSVRRSRVVLTPRCWREVAQIYFLRSDGGKKAVHRGELAISRKAIAQGRPECFRRTCMLVCAFSVRNCTRDRGCSKHPVFPAPSEFWRVRSRATLGRSASRDRECMSLVGWVERSETHHLLRRHRWVSLRSTHPTGLPDAEAGKRPLQGEATGRVPPSRAHGTRRPGPVTARPASISGSHISLW
jgi:hypothetical protein